MVEGMFQIAKATPEKTTLMMSSWLFPGIGIFMLLLGISNLLALFVAAHPENVLGPGVFCTAVGVFYGFLPYRIEVTLDRTLGELTREARALFRKSSTTERLAELESVAIVTGRYYWFFDVKRKNGGALRLFPQMKRTWTFTKVPPPDVVARGNEIADALGLPLAS
jgi:hypothetical protein